MGFRRFFKSKAGLLLCLLLLLVLGGCQGGREPHSTPSPVLRSSPSSCLPQSSPPSFSGTPWQSPSPLPEDSAAFSARTEGDGGTVAVWWWDKGKALSKKRGEYLDFLEKNEVNEIYLCWPNFQKRQLADFVKAAGKRGISVSLLSGDASWIDPENEGAEAVVEAFLSYQKTVLPEERLLSLHMDVEPHQREEFASERQKLLQWYADFVFETASRVRQEGERIGWDIPFWFDDFTVLEKDGDPLPLLDHLAQNADTLCLMSYRDTAEEILSCSKEELALVEKYGCQVLCGVETYSAEGDHVSFMEEGKIYMAEQTGKLYLELQQRLPKGKYGIAFHYFDTWYALKEA